MGVISPPAFFAGCRNPHYRQSLGSGGIGGGKRRRGSRHPRRRPMLRKSYGASSGQRTSTPSANRPRTFEERENLSRPLAGLTIGGHWPSVGGSLEPLWFTGNTTRQAATSHRRNPGPPADRHNSRPDPHKYQSAAKKGARFPACTIIMVGWPAPVWFFTCKHQSYPNTIGGKADHGRINARPEFNGGNSGSTTG